MAVGNSKTTNARTGTPVGSLIAWEVWKTDGKISKRCCNLSKTSIKVVQTVLSVSLYSRLHCIIQLDSVEYISNAQYEHTIADRIVAHQLRLDVRKIRNRYNVFSSQKQLTCFSKIIKMLNWTNTANVTISLKVLRYLGLLLEKSLNSWILLISAWILETTGIWTCPACYS